MSRKVRYIDEPEIVQVSVSKTELFALINFSLECADDLADLLNDRYPSRSEQPVQMRRFERELQVVNQVRAVVDSMTELTEP